MPTGHGCIVNIVAKQKLLHVLRLSGRDRLLLLKCPQWQQHASSKLRCLRDVGNIRLLFRRKTTPCQVCTKSYIITTKPKSDEDEVVQWCAKKNLLWFWPIHNERCFAHRALLNPLNLELNPICYLLALLGAHHFLHVSRIRVKLLTCRLIMSYIYIWSTHSWCF